MPKTNTSTDCKYCGAENSSINSFCIKCGRKIETEELTKSSVTGWSLGILLGGVFIALSIILYG